eukprot:6786186-Pyramimonas_sp.AAC.1
MEALEVSKLSVNTLMMGLWALRFTPWFAPRWRATQRREHWSLRGPVSRGVGRGRARGEGRGEKTRTIKAEPED